MGGIMMSQNMVIKAKRICGGKSEGEALVTRERLSFHGQTDPKEGIFKGPTKELEGACFRGKVLVFVSGKGASAGPRILDLACRNGNKPSAIINIEIESMMVQGCVLQDIPMVIVEDENIFDIIETGDYVIVDSDNERIIVNPNEELL